jgi:hypothetical protein
MAIPSVYTPPGDQYTARDLIIESYYLSGIVARDYEFTGGSDINDGLQRLNDFLTIKGAKTKLIPYFSFINDNLTAGQSQYFFKDLVDIDSFTFFLINDDQSSSSVRLSVWQQTPFEFFGVPRALNIDSLPIYWHMERVFGGAMVYVYPTPVLNYPFEIRGKFSLTSVTLDQDLSTVYDDWYLVYLKYGLAMALCAWRQVAPPLNLVTMFEEMEQEMTTLEVMDFSLRKASYFSGSAMLTIADATFKNVWRP